jgi:hypothetical protein
MWVSRLLAVLGVAAGVGVGAGFATAAPPPITHAAAATPADPSCSGLITLICGSESHSGDTNGGTNSNNGDSRSGGSSASQSGGGSSPGSQAHGDEHDKGDPDVRGCS